jgi:peroxiredoxin Q/BCP
MTDRFVSEGSPAPDFTLASSEGGEVSLSSFKGRPVVLYFYPKDGTPGCTREACDFRDASTAFKRHGAVVLGVSKDSLKSHLKFKDKVGLNFPLLADPDQEVLRAYGVLKEKVMYGKKVMGVERSTFLIDAGGTVRRAWRGVKVEGHVGEVLEALRAL